MSPAVDMSEGICDEKRRVSRKKGVSRVKEEIVSDEKLMKFVSRFDSSCKT
jgi:hypothetical protein